MEIASLIVVKPSLLIMPHNAFSLEYFTRNHAGNLEDSIGEYFFSLGPEQYTENFRYRISVEPVFGKGASVTDYGNDFTDIKLKGKLNIYTAIRPPSREYSITDTAVNFLADAAATAAGPFSSLIGLTRDGQMEFEDLMFLMWNSRLEYPSYSGINKAINSINLKLWMGNSFNFSDYGLVYHDWARDRHVEVIFKKDGFSSSRSISDTNTYEWELNLIGIREQAEIKTESFMDQIYNIRAFNPFFALTTILGLIDSIISLPLILTGTLAQSAQFLNRLTSAGSDVISSWEGMKNNFRADGKLISQGFAGALNNVGLNTRKKTISQKLKDQTNTNTKTIDKILNEYHTFMAKLNRLQVEAENLVNSLFLSIFGMTQEQTNSIPNFDSSAVLDESAYQVAIQIIDLSIQAQVTAIFANYDNGFQIVEIAGETWEQLARKYLNNAALAEALKAFNNHRVPAGWIKIPFDHPSLIISKPPKSSSRSDYVRQLLGEDLALTQDRDFEVAPNGDLGVTLDGSNTLLNNIIDIIDTPLGSLPMQPQIGNPAELGELHEVWIRNAYALRLLNSIRSDPRVLSAEYASETMESGRALKYIMKIQNIAGAEFPDLSL